MRPLLSVIVAVYNTECYLQRCIESILNQELKDIELILIDDGSTDTSPTLCEAYANRDPRVLFIQKSNGGLDSVRNCGLSVASGKYIAFVDSDDWVDNDIFVNDVYIMEENEDIDICISALTRDYPDGRVVKIFETMLPRLLSRTEAIEEMFHGKYFRWEMVAKIYRSRVFVDFRTQSGITVAEDLLNNWKIFLRSKTVFYSAHASYHYFFNESSMMAKNMQGLAYVESRCSVVSLILATQNVKLGVLGVKGLSAVIREAFVEKICSMITKNKKSWRSRFLAFIEELSQRSQVLSPDLVKAIASHVLEAFEATDRQLSDIVWDKGNIYIYGTGKVAGFATALIRHSDWNCQAYVISDGHARPLSTFYGLPVIYLSELIKDIINPKLIITTPQKYDLEIMENLKKCNINDVVRLDKLRNLIV